MSRYLLILLFCSGLAACQTPSGTRPTPQIIIQNPQGTPLAVGGTPAPATPAPIPNLLINGDFASDWSEGWERNTGDKIQGQSVTEIVDHNRASSGKALHLVHDGPSFLALIQRVQIDQKDVTVTALLNANAETPCRGILKTCTGAAGLVIELVDAKDKTLGEILYLDSGSDPSARPTSDGNTRFIALTPGWQTIRLNVRQEVRNGMPQIDPTAIKAIRVMVVAGARGDCEPGKCRAEVFASDIRVISD